METWTNTCGLPRLFNFEPHMVEAKIWPFPGLRTLPVLWRPRDTKPLIIRHEAELLVVRFWDLQREMGHVRRVEEEQGLRGVVALHDANQLLGEIYSPRLGRWGLDKSS